MSRSLRGGARAEAGAALLEVVLALGILVAAVTVIHAGVWGSAEAVQRMRLAAAASDLAVSVMSEMQLGIRPLEAGGPFDIETSPGWSYSTQVDAAGTVVGGVGGSLRRVEVVVRHNESQMSQRLVQWLKQPGEGSGSTVALGKAGGS